jgi:acetylornithine deacetylase/succinyl-diaminopimelate desuccinylase family protein
VEENMAFAVDRARLVEIELDGREPFRKWEPRDNDVVMRDAKARLEKASEHTKGLFEKIDQLRPRAISLLQELIRTPSVNNEPEGEKKVAELVARELRALKFDVKTIEPYPNRVSVVGDRVFQQERPRMLLYAHTDTVPAGDLSKWKHPPFGALIEDGKMFGRGTLDCKTGVAASIVATRALIESNAPLTGSISVAAAADEEAGGHKGIHELIKAGLLRGDCAIYVEALRDEIHLAANGQIWLRVTTKGEAGHTSKKELFTNAILKMMKVTEALDQMKFTGWKPHPHVPGKPYISVNRISGGTKENVIPDECSVICDIRTMPGQTVDSVMTDVNMTLDTLRRADPKLVVDAQVVSYVRPSELSPSEPIVAYTQLAAEKVIGIRPKATGIAASTDMRWAIYDAGIPMICYSCGSPAWHIPDEYAILDDYINTIKILSLATMMVLTPP